MNRFMRVRRMNEDGVLVKLGFWLQVMEGLIGFEVGWLLVVGKMENG